LVVINLYTSPYYIKLFSICQVVFCHSGLDPESMGEVQCTFAWILNQVQNDRGGNTHNNNAKKVLDIPVGGVHFIGKVFIIII
jgi:hypothetical protein